MSSLDTRKNLFKRQLQLQNGEIIEEHSDELDNATESNASEVTNNQTIARLASSEVQALKTTMCKQIVYDLIDLVVETMVEEEMNYDRVRSSAVVERADMTDNDQDINIRRSQDK